MRTRNHTVDPAKLKPHPRNTRTHSKAQIRLLGKSIDTFGFTVPIVIDEKLAILAGEARYRVALAAGLDEVLVVQLEGLSEARRRAYILADNKIAAMAGWDRKKLVPEIVELQELLVEDGLDISITGFEIGECPHQRF